MFLIACQTHLVRLRFLGAPINVRDAHDGNWKLQVFLVRRAGWRARTWHHAFVHAHDCVRTVGNIGRDNLGDRLFDLSEKAETYSTAV